MTREKYLQGLRDGVPIGLGYLAVSFGLGISCRNAGLNTAQGFLISFLNNASAGEYGGITVISEDAGFLMMAAMMLVINARYMLMSCALSQRLAPDMPLYQRMLVAFDLTDEVFGIAIAQPGYLSVWYYVGFSVMLFGMFLAIIVPEGKKNRVVLGCIAVSFLAGGLAAVLPLLCGLSEGMRILLLTVVISAVAAALFPHKEEERA